MFQAKASKGKAAKAKAKVRAVHGFSSPLEEMVGIGRHGCFIMVLFKYFSHWSLRKDVVFLHLIYCIPMFLLKLGVPVLLDMFGIFYQKDLLSGFSSMIIVIFLVYCSGWIWCLFIFCEQLKYRPVFDMKNKDLLRNFMKGMNVRTLSEFYEMKLSQLSKINFPVWLFTTKL